MWRKGKEQGKGKGGGSKLGGGGGGGGGGGRKEKVVGMSEVTRKEERRE